MNRKLIFTLILSYFLPYDANAINATVKQKYPYTVLTNDYGILNEEDLDSYHDGVKPPPFFPKKGYGYIYWQCFPRDKISIILKDMGYSSEDIGWTENYSDLIITVSNIKGLDHEYSMRKVLPTSGYEERFNLWLKLMKNEKYVCLAGSLIDHDNDKKLSSWVFERMKTPKGHDSYFEGAQFKKK